MGTPIINITCPTCNSIIESTPDSLTIKCKYCNTQVNLADYTSPIMLNADERLESYNKIANNSFNIEDFESAENYYRLICEINPSTQNLSMYNICRFLNGNTEYHTKLLNDTYNLDEKTKLIALKNIYNKIHEIMEEDLEKALRFCSTQSLRKEKTIHIHNSYKPYFDEVADKITKLDPEFRPTHTTSYLHTTSSKTKGLIICSIIFVIILYFILK